jgi:hypothetical protein
MSKQESIGYWDHSDKPHVVASHHWGTGPVPQVPELSLEAIRELVREEVRKALSAISIGREPDGLSGE